MKKTMIYLDDGDHAALKHKAAREGTSMAELIRQAVADMIQPKEPDYFGFVGIAESPAGYRTDTSERAESELLELLKDADPHD